MGQEITLATLPQKSKQEVFDYVAKHLLTQNERAKSGDGLETCLYRMEVGGVVLRCAGGCLIDPSEYHKGMEGNTWHSLVQAGGAPDTHEDLITSLQKIHDIHLPNEWPGLLDHLAASEGLKPYDLTSQRL